MGFIDELKRLARPYEDEEEDEDAALEETGSVSADESSHEA